VATRGDWTRNLRELVWASAEEAKRLGQDIEKDTHANHVVLALLRPGVRGVASEALRACGLTYERFGQVLVQAMSERPPEQPLPGEKVPPDREPRMALMFLGRSEGIAIGHNADVIRPEHLLVSALWDTNPYTTTVLERLGTSREAIRDKLVELGADVPDSVRVPAAIDVRRDTVVLPIEQWRRVSTYLSTRLPPGTDWGWNVNNEAGVAWFNAEGIDLPGYIEQALREPDNGEKR
jgi:hypothetical protein